MHLTNVCHSVVYANPAFFAGWPANHGRWQYGNEFLFGFLRGKYGKGTFHRIQEPFEKVLARSLDGGLSWEVEFPNVDFDCLSHVSVRPPYFSLANSIIRVSGCYDTGGDFCIPNGGFYISGDRGKTWSGAFPFNGIDIPAGHIFTGRTSVLPEQRMVFYTIGHEQIWGTDACHVALHTGSAFVHLAAVCSDGARAAMPAPSMVDGRIVVLLRRIKRGRRDGWIDAFGSDDMGHSWRWLAEVDSAGARNGNPPALVTLHDGRLLAAYGNRDHGEMRYAISKDRGDTWETGLMRASESDRTDIGYPQLFIREDGTPVCVYYWTSPEKNHQHIAMTSFNA